MFPIRDTIRSRTTPFVNYAILAANLMVFLYETTLSPHRLETFFYLWGVVPARFLAPGFAAEVGFSPSWGAPFVTSMFLHAGLAHFVGNMWMLWIFGDNVEDELGHLRYLFFYLATGVAAALAHALAQPASVVPVVGASGAIAGVMGAYFRFFPRARVVTLFPVFFYPVFLAVPAVTYLFLWFFIQLYSGAFSFGAASGGVAGGGVAWWAHVGGFLAGLSLSVRLRPARRAPRLRRVEVLRRASRWDEWETW